MKKQDFDIKIFAQRFSQLLDSSQENTHSLAKRLGLNPGTISRYANALMAPKVPTLYALAEIFNVDPLWLMGFDESYKQPENTITILPTSENYDIIKNLAPDEVKLITAYRNNPDIRAKIIAFFEFNGEPLISAPTRNIKIAAYGGGVMDHKITATDQEIKDAIEESDDDQYILKNNNQ